MVSVDCGKQDYTYQKGPVYDNSHNVRPVIEQVVKFGSCAFPELVHFPFMPVSVVSSSSLHPSVRVCEQRDMSTHPPALCPWVCSELLQCRAFQ